MTIERICRKGTLVLHQDRVGENNVGESPIVLEPYIGSISITQGGLRPAVLVNIESVPELCRALRQLAASEDVR